MDSKQFLTKHQGIITDALRDYMSWWEKKEDAYKECNKALNDLRKVKL